MSPTDRQTGGQMETFNYKCDVTHSASAPVDISNTRIGSLINETLLVQFHWTHSVLWQDRIKKCRVV